MVGVEDARNCADVVILGAGPAGLLLANLLRAGGVDCVILERAGRERLADHYTRLLGAAGFDLLDVASLPLDGSVLRAAKSERCRTP